MTIAIVDYGVGNLTSVRKAVDHVGADSVITSDPAEVERADRIILPGVGHFSATLSMETSGLKSIIATRIQRGTPFLGICVGMQWMYQSSAEAPETLGLGLFSAKCRRFSCNLKSPHVGWNRIGVLKPSPLLTNIPNGSFFYFTHSYYGPVSDTTFAGCDYGGSFSALVGWGNAFGVQFHPEKSGLLGLKLLRNFCDIPC